MDNSPESYLHQGDILAEAKNYQEAIKCYDLASQNYPKQAYLQKGKLLVKLGNYMDALKCFKIGVQIFPENPEFLDGQGCALQISGFYRQALQCFDNALQIQGASFIYCNKGITLLHQKEFDEAIVCFDKAISSETEYLYAYLLKGIALFKQGKQKEAKIFLQNNIAKNSIFKSKTNNINQDIPLLLFHYYDQTTNLPDVFAVNKDDFREKVRETIYNRRIYYNQGSNPFNNQARALAASQKYQKTLETIEKSIQFTSDGEQMLLESAITLRLQNNFIESKFCFNMLAHMLLTDSENYHYKGYTLIFLDKFKEGLEYYQLAIELNEKNITVLFQQGVILIKLDKPQEAIISFKSAHKSQPNFIYIYFQGIALTKMKQYDEAITNFNEVIQQNGQFWKAFLEKGSSSMIFVSIKRLQSAMIKLFLSILKMNVHFTKKKHQEAIECYDKVIQLNPKNPNVYFAKGVALNQIGQDLQAIEYYKKSISLINSHSQYAIFRIGFSLSKLHQFEEAIEYFNKVISIDNKCLQAYRGKGIALNELSRYKEAIACFDQAIQIDQNNQQLYLDKGKTLLDWRLFKEVISFFKPKLLMSFNFQIRLQAYLYKGTALYKQKQYVGAIEYFDKSLGLNRQNYKTLLGKANSLSKLKRFQEAISIYNQAIQITPLNDLAYLKKGNTLQEMMQLSSGPSAKEMRVEVISCYDQAIQLNPENYKALFRKGQLLLKYPEVVQAIHYIEFALSINPKYLKAHFLKGQALQDQQKYEESLISLQQAIKINPRHTESFIKLGYSLSQLNKNHEAIECYDKAIYSDPQSQDAYIQKGTDFCVFLAKVLFKLQMYSEALKIYDRLPKNQVISFQIDRGNILFKQEKYQEALAIYNEIIHQGHQNSIIYYHTGLALQKLNQHDLAVQNFDEALKIDYSLYEVQCSKGISLLEMKDYEKSISCFDEALKINPFNVDAMINKGLALHGSNRFWEALDEYEKALKINPKDQSIYCNKAFTLIHMNNYEEAIKCCDASLAIRNDFYCWFNKGLSLFKLLRYQEAVNCFNQVLYSNNSCSQAYFFKGQSLFALNIIEAALECFNEALKLDPQNCKILEQKSAALLALGYKREASKFKRLAKQI